MNELMGLGKRILRAEDSGFCIVTGGQLCIVIAMGLATGFRIAAGGRLCIVIALGLATGFRIAAE